MIFMPNAGDELTITFTSQAPLAWGTHRRNHTRVRRSRERYIPIPKREARRLGLCNSNCGNGLGINIFNVRSTDGVFNGQLKNAGCSRKGDVYAKQFQGYGDLRALEPWLTNHHAQIGDQIRFVWQNSTDIEMTFISHHD